MGNSQEEFIKLFNNKAKKMLKEGEDEFFEKLVEFNNTHFESQIDALKVIHEIGDDYINVLLDCRLVDTRISKIKAKTYWDSIDEIK